MGVVYFFLSYLSLKDNRENEGSFLPLLSLRYEFHLCCVLVFLFVYFMRHSPLKVPFKESFSDFRRV